MLKNRRSLRKDILFTRLSIRDYGPGIPKSMHKKLFVPFTKSASDAAHSAPGVGLGLAISRRLARQMNGDLILDESISTGTRFLLTLPLA
ncbi:MAG: ATP-binding protein [Acidobacteria bacterium]|nr:ATP-binding protein [Acidobacteriota bacterium]